MCKRLGVLSELNYNWAKSEWTIIYLESYSVDNSVTFHDAAGPVKSYIWKTCSNESLVRSLTMKTSFLK